MDREPNGYQGGWPGRGAGGTKGKRRGEAAATGTRVAAADGGQGKGFPRPDILPKQIDGRRTPGSSV